MLLAGCLAMCGTVSIQEECFVEQQYRYCWIFQHSALFQKEQMSQEEKKNPAGIPISTSKEALKPTPEAVVLPHEHWLNCKQEIMDEAAMLPGLQLLN